MNRVRKVCAAKPPTITKGGEHRAATTKKLLNEHKSKNEPWIEIQSAFEIVRQGTNDKWQTTKFISLKPIAIFRHHNISMLNMAACVACVSIRMVVTFCEPILLVAHETMFSWPRSWYRNFPSPSPSQGVCDAVDISDKTIGFEWNPYDKCEYKITQNWLKWPNESAWGDQYECVERKLRLK